MIGYALATLPVIVEITRHVGGAHEGGLDIEDKWYVDEAAGIGHFVEISAFMEALQAYSPPRGYLLGPTKSILVVGKHKMALATD